MVTEDYEKILRSPTLFAMKILGITPLRYQAGFLEDDSDKILVVGGRQIGKSTMLALKAIWTAFIKPNEDILILAPTFRQSKIVYERIMEMIGRTEFLFKRTVKFNLEETKFDNSSVIRCLTAGNSGEYVRGFSATVIIFDEASLIPDQVFMALEPAMAVRGSQLIMSGTPYGKRGYFYNEWANNEISKKWSTYRIPTNKNPLVKAEYLQTMKNSMTGVEYAQEFEAEFIDQVGRFYSPELIIANSIEYEYELKTDDTNEYDYYAGVDVGSVGSDETALVLIRIPKDIKKNKFRVVWAEGIQYKDLTLISKELVRKLSTVSVKSIFVDATGVGRGVVDMLTEVFGGKVEAIAMQGEEREKAYTTLKLLLERKEIELNVNDAKLRHQFGSYQIKQKDTGGIRITKEEAFHDDLVDALVLSLLGVSRGASFRVFEAFDGFVNYEKSWVEQTALDTLKRQPSSLLWRNVK